MHTHTHLPFGVAFPPNPEHGIGRVDKPVGTLEVQEPHREPLEPTVVADVHLARGRIAEFGGRGGREDIKQDRKLKQQPSRKGTNECTTVVVRVRVFLVAAAVGGCPRSLVVDDFKATSTDLDRRLLVENPTPSLKFETQQRMSRKPAQKRKSTTRVLGRFWRVHATSASNKLRHVKCQARAFVLSVDDTVDQRNQPHCSNKGGGGGGS